MKIVITAGGTSEKIDDVRTITNSSTGRLGYAVGTAFLQQYADELEAVYYLHGTRARHPEHEKVIPVEIGGVADLQRELGRILVEEKDATDDVLDLSDEKDTINIQIQCLPKNEAQYIATDLDSYEQYAMINTLEDLLSSMKLKETKIDTPDFITKTDAQSITLEDGDNTVKGIVVFMESDSSYYTYLIMAVDKTYDANEDVLLSSIMSLKEL